MDSKLNKRGIKNQIKGGAKEIEGKARKAIGDLTDNKKEQRKGTVKEVEGKVQKAIGDVQRDVAEED